MRMSLGLGLSRRAAAAGGGGNVAPVITGVPTISGTATVGNTLTASPAGVSGTPSPTRTWQWRRNGVDIGGATNSTYTLVAADYGVTITVRQIETNVAGSANATSAGTAIAAFDPATLSPTAWFRPNVPSLVYSNDGSATQAAVNSTVNLLLGSDAGESFGSNLATNGTFNTDLSGWTIGSDGAGWSVVSGRAYFNDTERAGNQFIRQNMGLVSGRAYRAALAREVVAGQMSWQITSGAFINRNVTGTGTLSAIIFPADAGDNGLDINPENVNVLCQFYIDNVVVQEHPSRFARQTTAGDRPTLREGGNGVRYLENVSSDTLNWTAPAGTYTVAYVIPDGTVTVLTSQALSGATNIMLASQVVEYIAVNRALTTEETSGLTAYLEGIANP